MIIRSYGYVYPSIASATILYVFMTHADKIGKINGSRRNAKLKERVKRIYGN